MTAFDTDVLTECLAGNAAFADRLAAIPSDEQVVPIVVMEEMIRGRLNVIRQAEAGKGRVSIELAYRFFEETLDDLREFRVLSFTSAAESLVERGPSFLRLPTGCRGSGQ
jgi:predicted nucleic acid-binding protein